MPKIDANKLTLEERVVEVNRVSKVVRGGRRFNYSAVVVVGDKNGIVGAGSGKANEVPDAIRKAVDDAKKHLVQVTIVDGTIPHPIVSEYGAATVLLRPAAPGTGVIAGGPVRAVVESAGIRDILSKSVGSSSKRNTVAATMQALTDLQDAASVAQKRHMTVEQLVGSKQRA